MYKKSLHTFISINLLFDRLVLPAIHVSPDISSVLCFNLINILKVKYSKWYLSDNIVTHARNGPMQKYLEGEFKWSKVQ